MTTRRGIIAAGILGFGFSGLIDVVVLHHIFQLHFLISNVRPLDTVRGLRWNIWADGVFQLVMLVVMGIGGGLLWHAERRAHEPLPLRRVAGAGLVGVGVFDLYDVVVDHWILEWHHATHGSGYYDPWWAAASVLIILVGLGVYAAGGRGTTAT